MSPLQALAAVTAAIDPADEQYEAQKVQVEFQLPLPLRQPSLQLLDLSLPLSPA